MFLYLTSYRFTSLFTQRPKESKWEKKRWYMEVVDGKKVKQMESVYSPGGQQVARGSLKQFLIDNSRSGDQFQRPINKCDWFIKTWVAEHWHPWGSQRNPQGAQAERLFWPASHYSAWGVLRFQSKTHRSCRAHTTDCFPSDYQMKALGWKEN